MTARSSQDQNATDRGNSQWCASWGSLISNGARALVDLMPEPFKFNQVLNVLATESATSNPKEKLIELAKITGSILKTNSDQGNLRWNHVTLVHHVLDGIGDGSLDRYIPRLAPCNVYGGSDSVLCMYTKSEKLPFQQHWAGSKALWERHISNARFSVNPSSEIHQIWGGLDHTIRHGDSNRGNPKLFDEQILLFSCMNEKKWTRDNNFMAVKDALEPYPVGSVAILGPGEADIWWPDEKGSPANNKWNKMAEYYFNILSSGKHPYIRGNAPLGQWISDNGSIMLVKYSMITITRTLPRISSR